MTSLRVAGGRTGKSCVGRCGRTHRWRNGSGRCVNRAWTMPTPSVTTSGTTMSNSALPEWEAVLSAAARLQQILPEAVLVGGTASALYAQHRLSRDADHVLPDLKAHFD